MQKTTSSSNSLILVIFLALVGVNVQTARARSPRSTVGPTSKNALETERALAHALATNNADSIGGFLAQDWKVISAFGDVVGKDDFLTSVRTGYLVRNSLDLSDTQVRMYGNVAVVMTALRMTGIFQGKPYDVPEQETDVLVWSGGHWQCVLTHECIVKRLQAK